MSHENNTSTNTTGADSSYSTSTRSTSSFPFRHSNFTPYHTLMAHPSSDLSEDQPTTQELIQQQQKYLSYFTRLTESCATKAITSGFMGGLMGLGWGLFTSILDYGPRHGIHDMHMPGAAAPNMKAITFRDSLKMTAGRSYSLAKTFSFIGLAYSATECTVEKMRGKHDRVNTVSSGCIVGGGLGAKAGVQAAFFGCVGFAAFSLAIDTIFDL